jgi:ElaB/YqjD/DUF883 family membrane-anchored ribosome-binding protein
MGKKPDQIENEIRQHRAEVTRRIDALQTRMQDQIGAASQNTRARVSGAVDEAKSAFKPGGMMQEHPLSTMAGALGMGVLLGVASDGFTSNGGRTNDSRQARSSSAAGGLTSLLSFIAGPAASTAQDELQQLVREGFGAFRERATGLMDDASAPSSSDDGNPVE